MIKGPERIAGQMILAEARKFGRQIYNGTPLTHIGESSRWLARNHKETLEREQTFGDVLQELNSFRIFEVPDIFVDVQRLHCLTDNTYLPSLSVLAATAGSNNKLDKTIEELEDNAPWANAAFDSKGTPVWSMVIKGYGMYIGKLMSDDAQAQQKVQKTFVRAFEAVALINHPDSSLVKDVLPRMLEQKDTFPPEIAAKLEELTFAPVKSPVDTATSS